MVDLVERKLEIELEVATLLDKVRKLRKEYDKILFELEDKMAPKESETMYIDESECDEYE